ncbi:hypothetical protein D5H75_37990 [Bailinhaonella thermotolerans]|uniref:Uncharacterized protein n=1 Tax=Bailinhaonella thermotolerans TaxID=1070861 RepID=A0A3A4APK1_9ACTN|nr:hypothetical protein D5H75_37990 [Bailinhaonella thermotolerans]
MAALPPEALPYLAEALALLEISPWTGRSSSPDNPGGNLRTLTFGGRGLLTYLVLEEQREVYVVRAQWL